MTNMKNSDSQDALISMPDNPTTTLHMETLGAEKEFPKPTGEWTPLSLAQHFHNIYERCAPEFGYDTRTETRQFNPESSNGKLMIAVCSEILRDFNAALAAEREKLTLATQMVQIESKRANEAEQKVQK